MWASMAEANSHKIPQSRCLHYVTSSFLFFLENVKLSAVRLSLPNRCTVSSTVASGIIRQPSASSVGAVICRSPVFAECHPSSVCRHITHRPPTVVSTICQALIHCTKDQSEILAGHVNHANTIM